MKVINRLKASDDFALTIKKAKHSVTNRLSSIIKAICYTPELVFPCLLNWKRCDAQCIKRQIRSICDLLIDYSSHQLDIVIIAKPGFLNRTFDDNKQALAELLVF